MTAIIKNTDPGSVCVAVFQLNFCKTSKLCLKNIRQGHDDDNNNNNNNNKK
jgi:hypothetical protein